MYSSENDAKKRAATVLREKLVKLITFWSDKIKMRFLCGTFFTLAFEEKNFFAEISALLRSMGTLFQPGSPKNRSFFRKECSICPREVLQQHNLSRQHFGVMLLVKNNNCCFCC